MSYEKIFIIFYYWLLINFYSNIPVIYFDFLVFSVSTPFILFGLHVWIRCFLCCYSLQMTDQSTCRCNWLAISHFINGSALGVLSNYWIVAAYPCNSNCRRTSLKKDFYERIYFDSILHLFDIHTWCNLQMLWALVDQWYEYTQIYICNYVFVKVCW